LRVPALALVLILAVSLGAFGAEGNQRGSSNVVTLTALHMAFLPTGIQEGY
jgi:uncharacterized membrane protein YgdD (TMEM256/DUF423 family)